MKTVAISGGFDPIHPGHIRLIQEAAKLGSSLTVILNNDNWLKAKKGFSFMSEQERREILLAIRRVDNVIITHHTENPEDMSVCAELEMVRPDVFVNAGDRKSENVPEVALCDKLSIELVFGATDQEPYENHSSSLIRAAAPHAQFKKTPWGCMETYRTEKDWWVKSLTIDPSQRVSLQKHFKRGETWFCVEGEFMVEIGPDKLKQKLGLHESFRIFPETIHRIANETDKPATLIEVAQGEALEDDIERLEDDYGRVA